MDLMDKIIRELHKAFDHFNKTKFNDELIEPIITIQSQPRGKKGNILGWCSNYPWWKEKHEDKEIYKYEINMTVEYLNRTYEELICTFLHEMVHISSAQKNIDDCSSRGNHNENFKKEAERIGLVVEKAPRIGWSVTTLSEGLLKEVQELDIDKSVFCLSKVVKPKEDKSRKVTPKYKYRCPKCGKEVTGKEEGIGIYCTECEEEFVQMSK